MRTDKNIDWDDVRYLLALAEEGSLSAAARRLSVNHSTVFRRVQQSEKRLGARLFDRIDNRYQLTEMGEQWLPHARRMAAEMDVMQLKLGGTDQALSGTIRITTTPGIISQLAIELIGTFSQMHPSIRFEVLTGPEMLDLGRREADIALRVTNKPPEILVGRELLRWQWAIYASQAYLDKHGYPDSVKQACQEHSWVGPLANSGMAAWKWLNRHVADDRIKLRSNNIATLATAVSRGLGIALLPSSAASMERLTHVVTLEEDFGSGFWILTHPELKEAARIRAFMQLAVEESHKWREQLLISSSS